MINFYYIFKIKAKASIITLGAEISANSDQIRKSLWRKILRES